MGRAETARQGPGQPRCTLSVQDSHCSPLRCPSSGRGEVLIVQVVAIVVVVVVVVVVAGGEADELLGLDWGVVVADDVWGGAGVPVDALAREAGGGGGGDVGGGVGVSAALTFTSDSGGVGVVVAVLVRPGQPLVQDLPGQEVEAAGGGVVAGDGGDLVVKLLVPFLQFLHPSGVRTSVRVRRGPTRGARVQAAVASASQLFTAAAAYPTLASSAASPGGERRVGG